MKRSEHARLSTLQKEEDRSNSKVGKKDKGGNWNKKKVVVEHSGTGEGDGIESWGELSDDDDDTGGDLGFPKGWKVKENAGKHYRITSPSGTIFTSKARALEYLKLKGWKGDIKGATKGGGRSRKEVERKKRGGEFRVNPMDLCSSSSEEDDSSSGSESDTTPFVRTTLAQRIQQDKNLPKSDLDKRREKVSER